MRHLLNVPLQQATVRSRGGFSYSMAVLESLTGPEPIYGVIDAGLPVAEFGNPVDPLHASHVSTHRRMEGDVLVTDIEILATPFGVILAKLIDETVFCLRGAGRAITTEGLNGWHFLEKSDYRLVAIDAYSETNPQITPPNRS